MKSREKINGDRVTKGTMQTSKNQLQYKQPSKKRFRNLFIIVL